MSDFRIVPPSDLVALLPSLGPLSSMPEWADMTLAERIYLTLVVEDERKKRSEA